MHTPTPTPTYVWGPLYEPQHQALDALDQHLKRHTHTRTHTHKHTHTPTPTHLRGPLFEHQHQALDALDQHLKRHVHQGEDGLDEQQRHDADAHVLVPLRAEVVKLAAQQDEPAHRHTQRKSTQPWMNSSVMMLTPTY
jgi:exonuclease VII large subunit